MPNISSEKIKQAVARLCIKANHVLPDDVASALRKICRRESRKPQKILKAIIENAQIAKDQNLAICQDTGLPSVFVKLGQNVRVIGDLNKAIMDGVRLGYQKGNLRASIVRDPLLRKTPGYIPAIIHIEIVKGSNVELTVLPKGFGCENKTRLKMFNPTAGLDEIKNFIIDSIKLAGPDACPPYVVGVGIGGSADYACLLAKKALIKRIGKIKTHNQADRLGQDLLKEINRLNIGPMGLGGKNTVLAVNILMYPTHIAGLPVAVSISCHALRRASAVL